MGLVNIGKLVLECGLNGKPKDIPPVLMVPGLDIFWMVSEGKPEEHQAVVPGFDKHEGWAIRGLCNQLLQSAQSGIVFSKKVTSGGRIG